MTKFQQWARDNFKPGSKIDEIWHPEIQAECRVMIDEAAAKRAKDVGRIREVVLSVDDLEEEFKGCIVFYHSFRGSIPMGKKLTKTEQAMITRDVPEELRRLFKGEKFLFGPTEENPFPEWKEFEAARNAASASLKGFGIPFIADAQTVVRISLIPDVEEACDKAERDLAPLLEKLVDVYPQRVDIARDKLRGLFNKSDYRPMEYLRSMFTLRRKWMHFGVPDVLKEIDRSRWEAERKRTAEVWAEVKQNGMLMIRKQVAEMVARLVDAVTPNEDGTRKKFYATSVTNLTDFFETFKNQDLANDTEMAMKIEELKALVSNTDIKVFKDDDALRKTIQTKGAVIQKALESMLVSSEARSIIRIQ